MKIKHVNGMFWNEDNGCFTVAEIAATEYDHVSDLPQEIADDRGPLWQDTLGVYYREDDDEDPPVASTV